MNETERTTPEQMLDILADHIKNMIAEAGTRLNTNSIAPLLEIYFKYSIDRGIKYVPHDKK